MSFGIIIKIARETTPIKAAIGLIVVIECIISSTFSTVSTGEFLNVRPKKSLICPIKIVTAIPEVKPVVIVNGINLIRLPNLQTPITISITPAMRVAITSPENPFVAIIPATIEANAAVGPAI